MRLIGCVQTLGVMMRLLAFGLVFAAACGTSNNGMTPGGDDDTTGDDDGSNGGSNTDPNAAFEVVSKDANLTAGQQTTFCYYFHTSNTEEVLVNKWVSDMTAGSHHAILYLNPNGQGQQADGTLDPSGNCGGFSLQGAPIWTYATQTEHQEMLLPTDDGNGKPDRKSVV